MVMGALRGAALLGAGALLCSVRVAHGAQAAARMAFASTAPELLHPGSPAAKLRASQVGTAVARVVSADARGEGGVHGGDLPSGNIFHMPQVNVLFFVDGVPIYGTRVMVRIPILSLAHARFLFSSQGYRVHHSCKSCLGLQTRTRHTMCSEGVAMSVRTQGPS
jgi:hypothetical protein